MTAVDGASFAKRLVAVAASPYQRSGNFAWWFARGKLAADPLFVTLLSTGAIPDAACLVDLGCGQGLLATWLHAARNAWMADDAHRDWPASWPAPPKVATYLGVDRSRRDIARAKPAMPASGRVFRGDVRTLGMTMLDRCDVVTMLDVLQYLATDAQERLVAAIAASLPPWGVVVLRVGDGASRRTDAIDLAVCALRGYPQWRVRRRTVAEWRALFESHGFALEVLHDGRSSGDAAPRRVSGNVLLRASRPHDEPAAAGPSAKIADSRSTDH